MDWAPYGRHHFICTRGDKKADLNYLPPTPGHRGKWCLSVAYQPRIYPANAFDVYIYWPGDVDKGLEKANEILLQEWTA